MNATKIEQYLKMIEAIIARIRQEMGKPDDLGFILEPQKSTKHLEPVKHLKHLDPVKHLEPVKEVIYLDLKRVQDDPKWPVSVPPFAISQETEQSRVKRACGLLDALDITNLQGLTFLDFGCGEGHVTQMAVKRAKAKLAVGYDIEEKLSWDNLKDENVRFTSNFHDIDEKFDVILLADVIDHAFNPEDVISKTKKLLADNGVIYARMHPWTSSHATHIYKKINKSYIHLFVESKQLQEFEPTICYKTLDPIATYHRWFKDFEIVKEKIISEPVPAYINRGEFRRILEKQGITEMKSLDLQFVDYMLKKKVR